MSLCLNKKKEKALEEKKKQFQNNAQGPDAQMQRQCLLFFFRLVVACASHRFVFCNFFHSSVSTHVFSRTRKDPALSGDIRRHLHYTRTSISCPPLATTNTPSRCNTVLSPTQSQTVPVPHVVHRPHTGSVIAQRASEAQAHTKEELTMVSGGDLVLRPSGLRHGTLMSLPDHGWSCTFL